MARNKRKSVITDKDNLKTIRKTARRRWRNKKANEKALKNAVNPTKPPNDRQPVCDESKHSPIVAELPPKKTEENPQMIPTDVPRAPAVKEIRSSEIVRSEKFLGCGTFGTCYLAHYRGYLVTVKEFKVHEKMSLEDVKKDVRHEAKMITHLGDHRCLPLLFGVVTRSEPLRLVIQFHGEKDKSVALSRAMRKKQLSKPSWLVIVKDIIKGMEHIHKRGILHNDLKANNVVLEKREEGAEWNPVIIDFGKARFIADPKPLMSLQASTQDSYRKRYPHIAPEIVCGKGRQSVASDIFSFGKMTLDILNLLPTATSQALKAAKRACDEEPEKRPSLKEIFAVL